MPHVVDNLSTTKTFLRMLIRGNYTVKKRSENDLRLSLALACMLNFCLQISAITTTMKLLKCVLTNLHKLAVELMCLFKYSLVLFHKEYSITGDKNSAQSCSLLPLCANIVSS